MQKDKYDEKKEEHGRYGFGWLGRLVVPENG